MSTLVSITRALLA